VRFTVTYPMVVHPANPDLMTRDALSRFCQTAERCGFDGVGFTDHPAPTARWLEHGGHDAFDPFVALAFCAAVTERIRLIPNIAVLPYRHPLIVAKMVATLDRLSEGRFTLAVATGYLRGEYRALGVEFEHRNALFDQAVEVMRGIWSEDGFSYEGDGIAARELAANPKPDPPPPLWIGGNSRMSRRRVARYGDGWTPFPAPRVLSETARTPTLDSIDDLAGMLEELWYFVDEAGRDRAAIDVAFGVLGAGAAGTGSFEPDAHLSGLEELAGLGVTWTHAGVPGDSLTHSLEALEQYGEQVIAPSRAGLP
jgi:probable F420-dependent oxidoreductase